MNNLSSYYGLTDSRMSATEKDLPVKLILIQKWIQVRDPRKYELELLKPEMVL